jgi:hypothetical protein
VLFSVTLADNSMNVEISRLCILELMYPGIYEAWLYYGGFSTRDDL